MTIRATAWLLQGSRSQQGCCRGQGHRKITENVKVTAKLLKKGQGHSIVASKVTARMLQGQGHSKNAAKVKVTEQSRCVHKPKIKQYY